MKKTMILAAFAALVSLASCQKGDVIDNNGTDKKASPVFTASIAGATRTTVDLTEGKVAWEADDEITVTDASSASAVYEIESIDGTTGEATFIIKDGETALGSGPYTATYGTEPSTSQTYSATAGKLYMTAPETSSKSFTFTVQCGLMKLNLTKTGESVKSIAVTGTPTDGTETTYTLTCTEAQSIASAKDFCIALPEGSYTKIVITNATDDKCFLNSASGLAIEANHIKPVTFGASKINFTTGKATATIGESNVDVKWIQLWKDGLKFAEFNVGAANNKPEDYGNYGKYTSRTFVDYATTNWGEKWRTPTIGEWGELFANCTYEWTAVNGVNGCIFTGKGDYKNNSIFLPAAGYYMSGTKELGETCKYLSATMGSSNYNYMYCKLDSYGDVSWSVSSSYSLSYGCPVRAVLAE